jgi:hypothetical protein
MTYTYEYNFESYLTLAEAEIARNTDIANLWVNTELWVQPKSITQHPNGGWMSGDALTASEIVAENFTGNYSVHSPLLSLNHMPVSALELPYFIDLYYNLALSNIFEILEVEVEEELL